MEQFLKLGTDPYEVIRLFPDLVSQPSNANETNEPEPNLPKLQGRDLENGLLALIDFLTEVRYKLINDSQVKEKEANEKAKGKNIAHGDKLKNMTSVATEQLLKIIDTTLLKCYLQVLKNITNYFLFIEVKRNEKIIKFIYFCINFFKIKT
jgi:hypothetical protein